MMRRTPARRRGIGRMGANPLMRSIEKHHAGESATPATYGGVLFRTAILLTIVVAIGAFSYTGVVQRGELVGGLWFFLLAPIIGLISVIIAMRSLNLAPFFSIIYAICQGVVLGAISGIYTLAFGDGIVPTAVMSTFGVALAMLFLFRSGIIRVTSRFRKIMFVALIGLLLSGLIMLPLFFFAPQIFGIEGMMLFYMAIIIVSVIVASLYLVIDFDDIQKTVEAGADRQYEWPLALSFIITLLWLYVELLRLIAIISARSRR